MGEWVKTPVFPLYVLLLSQGFRAKRKSLDIAPNPSLLSKEEAQRTFKGFVQSREYVEIQGQNPRSSDSPHTPQGFLPSPGP